MSFSFKTVTSTQSVIKDLLKEGKIQEHLDYVLAEEQTSGRGRQGRAWVSGPGNLMASIFISKLEYPLTWFPHWVCLSVVSALQKWGVDQKSIRIKWPNDVLVNGLKISGVICEKVAQGVIAGVGVNIRTHPEGVPSTSLGKVIQNIPSGSEKKFLEFIIESLSERVSLESLREKYESFSLLRADQLISWVDPSTGEKGSGTFVRYGEHGEIWVKLADQKEKPLYSEEIHLTK